MPSPDESLEIIVQPDDEPERIDKYIAKSQEEFSRTLVQKMIKEGNVLVGGKPVKANHIVKPGDTIEIEELPLTELDIPAENIPLVVVYEDDDVLVVDKPSGMVTHPAPGHYTGTLVNALLYHLNTLSDVNGPLRPGIVHRIDKDTSGLLMVAKNDHAHQILADELKQKTTKREYVALVEGILRNQKGTIDEPIGRDVSDRKKMAVRADGKRAVTHFEVLERFRDKTLILCRLETGRTHQIRVHMASIGYPLVGDPVYGHAGEADGFGQYLHAKTLGFTHPRTGAWMEFQSPVPAPFQAKIDALRQE